MLSFRNHDNTVGKYVHMDGSETSIKCVSSCDTIVDPATGSFYSNNIDRRKYTVFVSSSVGCFMKCKFCYLTIKDSAYKKIAQDQLAANLKQAIEQELVDNPSNQNRYAKLCWMGMGEDHMIDPRRTLQQTLEILDFLVEGNLALGLDGVDISSVLSRATSKDWISYFSLLNKQLEKYNINPLNTKDVHTSNRYLMGESRSRLRFFYSLHSAIQSERDMLIPKALPLNEALLAIDRFYEESGCNVILHHMFLEGENDSDASIDALIDLMQKRPQHELRILRYNACSTHSPLQESLRFDKIIAQIAKEIPRLKVQISTGKEVTAACGQFVVKKWEEPAYEN